VTGLIAIVVMIMTPLAHMARAQKISVILAREQEPFWMTGGSIALSNLGTAPPAEAKWWWSERIAIVFVRHIAVRCSIDAFMGEPIWQDPALCSGTGNEFCASRAAEILKDFLQTPRYRQLVRSFSRLASLEMETDLTELEKLKAEAASALAEELRAAEERVKELRAAQQKAPETPQTHFDCQSGTRPEFTQRKAAAASWDTLIIPQSLRANLEPYCRILRDYLACRAQGVHLPKGLLLYGPPGCGKTQIAKTLSAEGGLNFMSLSTADCKVRWIGHAAAKIKETFTETRAKQPTLIFIDEPDAVAPQRGAYHDCLTQEITGQLMQELDGLLSDTKQSSWSVPPTGQIRSIRQFYLDLPNRSKSHYQMLTQGSRYWSSS